MDAALGHGACARRSIVVIRDDLLQLEVDKVVGVERALLLLFLRLHLGLAGAVEVDIRAETGDTFGLQQVANDDKLHTHLHQQAAKASSTSFSGRAAWSSCSGVRQQARHVVKAHFSRHVIRRTTLRALKDALTNDMVANPSEEVEVEVEVEEKADAPATRARHDVLTPAAYTRPRTAGPPLHITNSPALSHLAHC